MKKGMSSNRIDRIVNLLISMLVLSLNVKLYAQTFAAEQTKSNGETPKNSEFQSRESLESTPLSGPNTHSSDADSQSQANEESNESSEDSAEASIVVDDESLPEEEEKSHGLFGENRIGALVSLGMPDVLRYSIDSKLFGKYGLSVGYANFKSSINDIKVSIWHVDISAKYFPFEGNMYGGLSLGANTYKGDLTKEIGFTNSAGKSTKANAKFRAEVKRTDLKPSLGWQWIASPGFTIDMSLGWSVSLKTSSSLEEDLNKQSLSSADLTQLKKDKDYAYQQKNLREEFVDRYTAKGLGHIAMGFGWML